MFLTTSMQPAPQREPRSPLSVPGLAATDTLTLLHEAQLGTVIEPSTSTTWAGRHVAVVTSDEADPSSTVFIHAAQGLGAHVSRLKPAALGLRKPALPAEALCLLGRLYNAIGCAGLSRSAVALLQRTAGVQVLSDLAAATHASRLLADVMTLKHFQQTNTSAASPKARLGIYGPPRSGLLRAWKAMAEAAAVEVIDLSRPGAEALAASCNFICRPSAPPQLWAKSNPGLPEQAETSLAAQQGCNHLLVVQALLRNGLAVQQ